MNQLITISPDICHGKPTIRGSRLLVATVLELLASGMSYQELISDYANLTENDILACLEYAAQLAHFRSEPIAA